MMITSMGREEESQTIANTGNLFPPSPLQTLPRKNITVPFKKNKATMSEL